MQTGSRFDSVIIGAGMAGLTCARALAGAGQRVTVLDKGRGIGGRMATRRVTLDAGAVTFDHGAQMLPATDPAFRVVLEQAGAEGWGDAGHLVGLPGMSGVARALGRGLDIRQRHEVTRLSRDLDGWRVTCDDLILHAGRVILTIPAPQAARLLPADHPAQRDLAQVRMQPSLTLMAALPADSPRPYPYRLDPDHPLAWVAQDSSKPGRSDAAVTWVAQASPDFSARHLEDPPEATAARMLPLLAGVIGADPGTALYVAAHRWRYAQADQPLGRPFLSAPDGLYLGGDWCIGARAEDAWASGRAIADDVLGLPDAG